jgi:hypothetical protein
MPWPKGRSRKKTAPGPEKPKPTEKTGIFARAGNNWDAVEWRDRSFDNRFGLPEEAHNWLRQNKLDAQWNTETVYGEKQDRHFNELRRNGWEPVEPGDIPGVDTVEIGGSRLCVRPMHISDKARKAERSKAQAEWDSRKQMLGEGVPLPSGAGGNVSARRANFIRSEYERIEVPEK